METVTGSTAVTACQTAMVGATVTGVMESVPVMEAHPTERVTVTVTKTVTERVHHVDPLQKTEILS
jgi:hypothetical protein